MPTYCYQCVAGPDLLTVKVEDGVATEVEHRRQGHARAVVTHLVDRIDALGVARADLTASEEGEGLYRSLGFEHSPAPLLRRWRR